MTAPVLHLLRFSVWPATNDALSAHLRPSAPRPLVIPLHRFGAPRAGGDRIVRVEIGDVALDLTADQVADLRRQLGVDPPAESRGHLLDAAGVADLLGVGRDWVYDHAAELGGERLGDGPRPRWRFDPAKVEAARASSAVDVESTPEPAPSDRPRSRPRRKRESTAGGAPLLKVRGSAPYAGGDKAAPGRAQTQTGGLTKGGKAPMASSDRIQGGRR